MVDAVACTSLMLPMPPHQCRFCGHANPDGAKYCNECGSQLNLRPCRLCDAINDVAADYCHKCGAALPAQSVPAVAPGATFSSAVAPLREGELAAPVGKPDAIAGNAGTAGDADAAPGASPDDHRPGVGTHPASRFAWVAAALAAVGIAAYLAYSPDRVDDAAGPSQARPGDPTRNAAGGSAASASPAPPEAMPTATSSSGTSEPVPVDAGAPRNPAIATEPGAEAPTAGVSNQASGTAPAPEASPVAQPSAQPTASPAATQAAKAKAKPKAKPKPKPKPKAKPKSQSAQ